MSSLQYQLDSGAHYVLNYQELREDYYRFCAMNDSDFIANLPQVLHFACVVGFFKDIGIASLSDEGIIHELVHLLVIPGEPLVQLSKIRGQFKEVLELA